MSYSNEDFRNRELDSLFAQYKSIVPDPEPGAGFMPELWRRIEARQGLMLRMKKLTQVFVAAAAAICILFATVLSVPRSTTPEARGNYVDVLAEAYPTETLAAHGIIPHEGMEARTK
jgi:hypothetical protein